jgi:hypothetical protein
MHVIICRCAVLGMVFIFGFSHAQQRESRNNQSVDGYKGIWFALNQVSEYGDKYSGGLGTYTAHHMPMAIYAPAVNKTFFVYGGTTGENERYLLCMIGSFDHDQKTVSRPVVVHDKNGVDDPHDNPSVMLDADGYIWVFVSGRGNARKGYKYKSSKPYAIDSFEMITEEVMTYPQPMYMKGDGYFHFFTKYSGVRELYFEKSANGIQWTQDVKLAGIKNPRYSKSGHYQVSNFSGDKMFTFFNWHPDGNVDKRTNIYYVQTRDFGDSFETVYGQKLALPLQDIASPALIMDYESMEKNIYICDAVADGKGNPVLLYVTSDGHQPGPQNGPREWRILFWNGKFWDDRKICESDHNYDMGSVFIQGNTWRVIAPIDTGPQEHGAGGEIVVWESKDKGVTWQRKKELTFSSERNHNYVRRVVNGKRPFEYFWADGDPHKFSPSHLYFGDGGGNVWKLPYDMQGKESYRLEKFENPER